KSAIDTFKMTDPSASVPALARALSATRDAMRQLGADPDVTLLLDVKERQIQDAINTALGIVLVAAAQPAGTEEPPGPFAAFAAPAVKPPVVPGQTFQVRTEVTNRSALAVQAMRVTLEGKGNWAIGGGAAPTDAHANEPVSAIFTVTVPQNADVTRPSFTRTSIQDARYTVTDDSRRCEPVPEPPLTAIAAYSIDGVGVEVRQPITRLEASLPYGYD